VGEARRSAWFGWLMVLVSGAIMGTGFGTQVSVSVFLQPLQSEFGWARGDISFAYSLAAAFSGLGAVVMGHLADRISPRIQVVVGACTMGVAYFLLSHSDQLWQFHLLYGVLVGGLCQGSFMTPLLTNVGFWFERNRGLALAATLAGQSLGGALMPLLTRYLITEVGWRQAYVLLGYGAWAFLIPLALMVRQPPHLEEMRRASRAAAERHGAGALTPTGFTPGQLGAYLGIAGILCCICMAIPALHIVSLALDAGIPTQAAASVLTVVMVLSIVGRLGIGQVADTIGGMRALWLASFGQTVMIFWFTQVHSLVGLYLVALLYAPAFGAVIPAYTIVVREMVPVHRIGSILGWVLFLSNVGMGIGGFLGGALFDLSGNYMVPFGAGALAGTVNLMLIGWLHLRTERRRVAAAVIEAA
jgi:MFS family permease